MYITEQKDESIARADTIVRPHEAEIYFFARLSISSAQT